VTGLRGHVTREQHKKTPASCRRFFFGAPLSHEHARASAVERGQFFDKVVRAPQRASDGGFQRETVPISLH
jgi:hypothetical protein